MSVIKASVLVELGTGGWGFGDGATSGESFGGRDDEGG